MTQEKTERVLLIEDNSEVAQMMIRVLMRMPGVEDVAYAATMNEALKIISEGLPGITKAFVDANLEKGIKNGQDGKILSKKIKETNPEIDVIGISGEESQADDENIDKYIGKGSSGMFSAIKAIFEGTKNE